MKCPNVNLKSWVELRRNVTEERAYFLWDKYDGSVPEDAYNQYESVDEAEIPQIQEQELSEFDIIHKTNLDRINAIAESLSAEHSGPIFAKEYKYLVKHYNDTKTTVNPSRVKVERIDVKLDEYENPDNIYVKFTPKDWAIQEAYDAAVKKYNEILEAPVSDERKIEIASNVEPEEDGQLRLFPKMSGARKRTSSTTLAVVQEIANKLKSRFGIQYKVLKSEEATALYNSMSSEKSVSLLEDGTAGFYDRNSRTAYLVEENMSAETAVHEIFGHPFLDIIKNDPNLRHIYTELALQVMQYNGVIEDTQRLYAGETDNAILDEAILAVLGKVINDKLDIKTAPKGLIEAIRSYFKALFDFVKQMFGKSDLVQEMRYNTTMEALADYILYGKGKMNLIGGQQAEELEALAMNINKTFSTKEFGKYKQSLITLKETIHFGNEMQQALMADHITETGAYDLKFIKNNMLAALATVYHKTQVIRNASGIQVAKYDSSVHENNVIIENITITKGSSDYTIGAIAQALTSLTNRGSFDNVLIKIGDSETLVDALIDSFQDLAIGEQMINGEKYIALSTVRNEIANRISFSKKSKLVAAAKENISPATSAETNLPSDDELLDSRVVSLLHNIKVGLTTNLTILDRSKSKDEHVIDEMKRLIRALENNSVVTNAITFIDFARRDVNRISNIVLDMTKRFANGEQVGSADINFIKMDFIPLYSSTMKSIHDIYNAKDYGIFKGLPQNKIDDIIDQVRTINGKIDEAVKAIDLLITGATNPMWAETADTVGSTTMKDVLLSVNTAKEDLSTMGVFIGSVKNKKSEHLRALDKLIVDIDTKVIKEVANDGTLTELANAFKDLKKKSPLLTYHDFMEFDGGKATGYMLTDLKRGKFSKDISNFRKKLAKEFGLVGEFTTPTDLKELMDYNNRLDEFKSEVAERRFTPEYYEARRKLSNEAAEALDAAKDAVYSIMSKHVNSMGKFDTASMTPTELSQFYRAKKAKSNLTSMVYMDGTDKLQGGTDYNIAKEISEFYKSINEGIGYVVNKDLFNDAYRTVRKDMPKDEADRWYKANTKEVFDDSFWVAINDMEKEPQVPAYEQLRELRKSLIAIGTNPDTREVSAAELESIKDSKGKSVADKIRQIDQALSGAKRAKASKETESEKETRIQELKRKYLESSSKEEREYINLYAKKDQLVDSGLAKNALEIAEINAKLKELESKVGTFNEIKNRNLDAFRAALKAKDISGMEFSQLAEIVPTEEYDKEYRAAADEELKSPGALAAFDKRTSFINAFGYRQLYSHYTKLEPKDKSLISREPNSIWSEMDPASEYINKNYNEEEAESGMIPKRNLYDNSAAYNKLAKNPQKKDFLDKLVAAYAKANANYDYIKSPAKYRLAQIPGSFWERAFKGDRFASGFKEAMKDKVKWQPYDNANGDYDTMGDYRVDGSKVRFVPTKYKTMLEDRDSITRDLLGAFAHFYTASVSFKHYSEKSADIDLMLNSLKLLSIKDTEKGEIKGPGQSNIYQRASNLVSNTVYGDQMSNEYNYKFLKHGRQISIAKPVKDFINYVKKLTLSQNIFSIIGNFGAAAVNLKTEATCGIWMNNHGLAKGQKELLLAMPSLVATDLNSYSNNKLIVLMRSFQLTKSKSRDMSNLHGNAFLKNAVSNFHYGAYTAGDLMVKAPMMVAVLSNFKPFEGKFYSRERFITERFPGNRSTGELVFDSIRENLYDAFTVEDGNIKLNPEYASVMDEQTWNYAANIMHDLGSKLDGTLTQADRGKLHADAFASALFINRGWMQVAFEQRFTGKRFNYRLQQDVSGTLTTLPTSAKILMYFLVEKARETARFELANVARLKMTTVQDKFESHELYNFRKTATDIKMIILTSVAAIYAKGLIDDDDDKKSSLSMFLYVALKRIVMELGSSMSPGDAFGLLQNPTTAQGPITEIREVSDGFFDGTLGDRMAGGRYMYMLKWLKSLIKLTPGIKNVYENFIKPDLQGRDYFMDKNLIGVYNLVEKGYNITQPSGNEDAIQALEDEKFEYKASVDNYENTYKFLGESASENEEEEKRRKARLKTRNSKKINREIKKLKDTE